MEALLVATLVIGIINLLVLAVILGFVINK
jgi:hypothetical protein